MDRILNAENGAVAIAEANKLLSSTPGAFTDVRSALYHRVYSKVGPEAYKFSPRVSNIWFDYTASLPVKLAALTWAAVQDVDGTDSKNFDGRVELAKELLQTYTTQQVNRAMAQILESSYHLFRLSKDVTYLRKALEQLVHAEVPSTPIPVHYEPESWTTEENNLDDDVWMKARLERLGN